jgi:quercetin dioxygenase-like cupin family protein
VDVYRTGTRPSRRGPEQWFTGEVWLDEVVSAPRPARLRAVRVTFTPAARTAWHTHPLGQTLLVLAGTCLLARADGTMERVKPGDVAWIEPGEVHWHGAPAGSTMVHLAMQEAGDDDSTADWGEQVTDAEHATADAAV